MLLKLKKNKKGFTLIELIVVVAILAILAAIAVPNFISLSAKAQENVNISNAAAIAGAVNVYNALNPGKEITAKTGVVSGTLKDLWPKGMSTAEETAAMALIDFNSGVCIVNKPSAAPAAT